MSVAYANDKFIPLADLGLPHSIYRLQEVAKAQDRMRRGIPTPRISRRCLVKYPPLRKVGGRLGCWLSEFEDWRSTQK